MYVEVDLLKTEDLRIIYRLMRAAIRDEAKNCPVPEDDAFDKVMDDIL